MRLSVLSPVAGAFICPELYLHLLGTGVQRTKMTMKTTEAAKERAAWIRVEAALATGKNLRVPISYDKQTGVPIRFRTYLAEHFKVTREGYRAIKGSNYMKFEWTDNRVKQAETLARCLETGAVYTVSNCQA